MGLSLGGTLLAVTILSLLVFTVANLSVSHLHLLNRSAAAQTASNAARSAVSAAISEILKNNDFGKTRAQEHIIRFQGSDARALLTFSKDLAAAESQDYSTNNLLESQSVSGAMGTFVAPGDVHLIAVGHSHGVSRRVEAVLHVPDFPWAVGSGGRIDTRDVVVGALPPGVWPPPSDPAQLLPADMIANNDSDQAIVLAGDSDVLGNLQTPGKVELRGGQVRGTVMAPSAPVKLPTIDIASYDPIVTNTKHFELEDTSGPQNIVGCARASAPLGESVTFDHPLELNNACLYVQGDLKLPFGVKGKGTLIVTGDIEIAGSGIDLEGLTSISVASGGHVRLRGGSNGSFLRGFFFAEKGLDVRALTLVGSLLTGNLCDGVHLDKVNVIYEKPQISMSNISEDVLQGGVEISGSQYYTRLTHLQMRRWAQDPKFEPGVGYEGHSTVDVDGVRRVRYLYFEFQYENGLDYPITIDPSSISAGMTLGPLGTARDPGPRRLLNEADFQRFLEEWSANFRRTYQEAYSYYEPGDVDLLIEMAKNGLIEQMREGPVGLAQPNRQGRIVEDLSRFLPLQDRMRVLTWKET